MNEQETIADIIAEMRIFKCRNLETGELELCTAIANYLADRLAAAHEREHGNAAKLREALKSIWKEVYLYAIEEDKQDFAHLHESMLENPPEYKDLRNSFFAIAHLVDAALAAPPRNCDVAQDWLRDLYVNFKPPASVKREMPPEWADAVIAFCRWLLATHKKGNNDADK